MIETRLLIDGGRRRRHQCHDCLYRWTTWVGQPPRRGASPDARPRRKRAPLTADEVLLILTSDLSATRLARELECSKQAVCAVRRGLSHAHEWPELPRVLSQGGRSCLDCRRWKAGECELGLPDPLVEGVRFAGDCVNYCDRRMAGGG